MNLKTIEALGIELVGTEKDEDVIRLGEAILTKKRLAYKNIDNELCITNGGVWNPAEDIRDAWQLEEKVKEMGIQGKYASELFKLVLPLARDIDDMTFLDLFDIANATPEQRTKAFLLAMEPGN